MRFVVLTGLPGVGKTAALARLAAAGHQVLDLEALAGNRGSSFGRVGLTSSEPTEAEFHAMITAALAACDRSRAVWLEDEGPHIGRLWLPGEIMTALAEAETVELSCPVEERIARLAATYGAADPAQLIAATQKIRRRLGNSRADRAISHFHAGRPEAAIRVLLEYFDEGYALRAARDTRRRLPPDQIPELLRVDARGSLPVMSASIPQRPALYERFVRPTPEWFADSALGIFVHWGAYSVPAWAEPIGALGAFEDTGYWFAHNPYAEWYFNTIRIEGSPARVHHEEVFEGRPYDEFLDQWEAEEFDPAEMIALFARAGARYVVPTTKHHDGITLWDAPGTGDRNTVRRGPKRDLIAEFAGAARDAGLTFGVYYSSGIDWHVRPTPPIRDEDHGFDTLPQDEAYARYVNAHVMDLIDRYRPQMLWGDINYPEAGRPESDFSFVHVLDHFYRTIPDGVINDRWGGTHWDFRTSEYEAGTAIESEGAGIWQNTRGIGFSFGFNQVEGEESYLTGPQAVELLVDVVSRGGNLLLNIGPDAAGRIPPLQRLCLEGLASWMAVNGEAVHGATPFEPGDPSDEPWTRWTGNDEFAYAIVRAAGPIRLGCRAGAIDEASAVLLGGEAIGAQATDGGIIVQLPELSESAPHVVRFRRIDR